MARDDYRDRDDRGGRDRDRDDRGRRDDSRDRRDSRDDRGGRDRDRDRDDRGRGRDDRGSSRDRDDRGGRDRGESRRSNYTYRPRTAEQIKKHGERTGFESFLSGDVTWFRPPSGESQARIFPPTHKDPEHYGFKVFTHPFIGANPTTYLCVEKHNLGGTCRVCEEMRALKADGASKEEVGDYSPREGYIQYVVDRDDRDAKKPAVWHTSWKQDRDIWEQTQSERTGETLLIDDPDQGYDVIIKKTGKGKTGTSYTFKIDRKSSPLMKSQRDQDDFINYAVENPLDERLKIHTYEEIDRNMSGTAKSNRDRDDDRDYRGRDRDDDRDRGRDRDDRDSRDRDRDDRGRDRDSGGEERDYGRDRDDDRGGGRSRIRDDGDRERNDDDDRPRGRGEDDRGGRDRDDDRGRGRDDGRDRDDRDSRDRGDSRDRDDRGRDRDDRDDYRSRDRRDERDGDDRGRDRDRDDRGRDRDDRGRDRDRDSRDRD